MKRSLLCLLVLISYACSNKTDELNFYIKSRDLENDRKLELFLDNKPAIEMELADNDIEENYSIFRVNAPEAGKRLIKVVLDDTIVKEVRIPTNGSFDVFIIANSTELFRDYNNLKIQEHLAGKGTNNLRKFADSLYDNDIIEQKFLEIHKDSVIEVTFKQK